MGVGLITNAELCEIIHKHYRTSPVVIWKVDEESGRKEVSPVSEVHVIHGADTKEILNSVLSFLPNPKLLDEGDFRVGDLELFKCLLYDVFLFRKHAGNWRTVLIIHGCCVFILEQLQS